MEDEVPAEESVGLDLDNKDRTITITGLSLEDAAKIILQEQETPGHYQILTQDMPDVPVSDGQACVTVVQEGTDDDMGGNSIGRSLFCKNTCTSNLHTKLFFNLICVHGCFFFVNIYKEK